MVLITEYTDPGCPFAFSAEPFRHRLQWLFGDQLEWRLRMVVLAETPGEYADKGFTPELQASSSRKLAKEYGMPMDTRLQPRVAATAPACRAVVAARLFAPAAERALLRRLRVRNFSGQMLDEPETISDAAVDAGIDPLALADWMASGEVESVLAEDKAASRAPSSAALALSHKLASWPGGMRYTCPSYEIARDGVAVSVPGFQPWAAYEVAVANIAPELSRRDAPEDVAEALRWAGTPLATREVAELCGLDVFAAREALGRVASETHVGSDGFWSLTG